MRHILILLGGNIAIFGKSGKLLWNETKRFDNISVIQFFLEGFNHSPKIQVCLKLQEDCRYTCFVPSNSKKPYTRSLTQFHSKEYHDLSRASTDGWPITWNYGFLLIFFFYFILFFFFLSFFLQHVLSQHTPEKEQTRWLPAVISLWYSRPSVLEAWS